MTKIKLGKGDIIEISEEQVVVYKDGFCIVLTEDFFESIQNAAIEKQNDLIRRIEKN